MTGILRAAAPRIAAAALAVIAVAVAWKMGGGAETASEPPRPDASAEATLLPGAAGDVWEARVRLVDVASDARFDMPRADAARGVLEAHWRKQRPPFVALTSEAMRFVSTVALRTSASESQWAMPLSGTGEAWAPDARIWNMNEGSYDQREAILAPAPGVATFHLSIPAGARFSFAEGTINATSEATVFMVSVVDERGRQHEVYRHALQPSASRRWTDASCDLSAFAGQAVELKLATGTAPPSAAEAGTPATGPVVPVSDYAGPGNGRPTLDRGVIREDVLATPGAPVALWGNPTLLARTIPRVPFNVLWIVVDALRPDVIPSFHDDAEDAAKLAAPWPPLEALLPKVPGLTPAIDDLARRGARFTQAYSAGCWTRPGTLAMLAGARSSELGIDTTSFLLAPAALARFYASDPPLLSLALRKQGVTTRAFVNNYFMVGYAPVGLEMGFERVVDHRYRTRDTLEVTGDATRWIRENKDTRFFAFVNYNSPHEPYEPPARLVERVPEPPTGPADRIARLYMAEAAKDDEAIGVLMRTLDETGLREHTLIVVTADHGETMSSVHTGTSGLDHTPIRYHHSASNFEETTKVPIVIVLPGVVEAGVDVKARTRTIDIAPTVTELLGLEPHARMSGASLVPLMKGVREAEPRVVVTEGRGSRAIIHGRYRLLVREGAARIVIQGGETREIEHELFDLVDDPGERHDLAPQRPDLVAEMRARLDAALKNVRVAGAAPASGAHGTEDVPTLHLRFVGGERSRRVSGTLIVGDARAKASFFEVKPVELGRDAFKIDGDRVDIALQTSPSAPVGFDVEIDPATTPISWELWLDDRPWPEDGIFGGPFGLLSPALRRGVTSDEARIAAQALALPTIDPRRDVGLFVTRRRGGAGTAEATDEGAEEMARLLREWGYARGSSGGK